MQMLSVKIDPLVQGAALPGWWKPLFESASNASAFLSPGWMSTWLASYGKAFTGDWISLWGEERCVAGCLLLVRRSKVGPFPVRLAVINTAAEDADESPWVEYNDVLCLAGLEDDVAAALAVVLQERSWDQLYLSGYVAGGVMARLRHRIPDAAVESVIKASPYVDLSRLTGGAESLLSSNSRSQIKRSTKLYGQRGPVCVSAAANLEEALGFLDSLAQLHREGWNRRGKDGGFRTERFLDFHRRLIGALWDEGGVILLRAAAGDKAIGYLYNFLHAGKVYFYQSGFSYEEDPKLKPGLVAHCLAIDHFHTLGLREYDFMAGEARYKASLANADRQLVWSWLERRTARMRVVRMARAFKHRLIARQSSDEAVTQE